MNCAPGPTNTSSPSTTPSHTLVCALDSRAGPHHGATRDEAERADDDVVAELRSVYHNRRRIDAGACCRCAGVAAWAGHASVPAPCRASLRRGAVRPRRSPTSSAGVDIDAGDELVERIKPLARRHAHRRGDRRRRRLRAACSACRRASRSRCWSAAPTASAPSSRSRSRPGVHDTIGIDLVAMCVNDVVASRRAAALLPGLLRSGKLDIGVGEAVVRASPKAARRRAARSSAARRRSYPGCTPTASTTSRASRSGVVERAQDPRRQRVGQGDAVIGAGLERAALERLLARAQGAARGHGSARRAPRARGRRRGAARADANLRARRAGGDRRAASTCAR